NFKRSANDKISTIAKPAKRGHKKKENFDPSTNINYLQVKPNNVNKRDCKKKQEIVASSSSQIIDKLLNNANNLQNDDEEVISVGELSQSALTSPRQLLPVLESRISPTQIMSQITIPSRQLSPALELRVVSPRQLSPTLGLRANAQNNFVPSNQLPINLILTSSRMLLTSDSNFSNNTLAADGSQFIFSNSMTLITAPNQDDKAKASQDCLEELKCLFLCVRNPPKKAIENLIRQVIKCDLNSTESIE
ncbi:3000_t:CDS:2, partial [Dentiscutata erythropus]